MSEPAPGVGLLRRSLRALGLGRIRARFACLENPVSWAPLEEEIGPEFAAHLRGAVLNAGAGHRDVAGFVKGRVTNLDLPAGHHNANIHVYASLDRIPFRDGAFDSAICNGVLEHVRDPDAVVRELARVVRPGGHLLLAVPFLQPEHLDPGDFQRYTADGLCEIARKHGFEALRVEPIGNAYQTLGWVIYEWLRSEDRISYWLLRLLLFPWIRRRSASSRTTVHRIATGYKLLARRGPAHPPLPAGDPTG